MRSTPSVTLDLYGMNGEEIKAGRTLFGGSATAVVTVDQVNNLDVVTHLVYRWGDEQAETVFSELLERSSSSMGHFPFSPSTIAGRRIWMQTIQGEGWHPDLAHPDTEHYRIIPYHTVLGEIALEEYMADFPTPVEALGKVASRYVYFGISTAI